MTQIPDRWGWLRGGIWGWVLAVALGGVGLVMMHHPMFREGMGAIQTDRGDSRLILYVLEHTFRWVGQVPTHSDLWSPPMFFPASNVGAYSDILVTVAPIYWAGRSLGLAPDSAFQAWMLVVSALNYGSTLALLRWGYRCTWPSAAFGSFLVAFGAPRVNQMGHQQLVPIFFGVATLFALSRLFAEPRPTRLRCWLWWEVAVGGIVAQLYAGFYNGWFLLLSLGVATVWSLILPGLRWRVLGVLGRDLGAIGLALGVGAWMLEPFLTHYLAAARELGPRDAGTVLGTVLFPSSWGHVGPNHWLGGWTAAWGWGGGPPWEIERRAGFGLVTPIVGAVGWWLGRDRPLIRIAAPVALTLMLAATGLPGDDLANLALAITLLIAARFDHDRSRPALGWLALALLIATALGVRFPSWRVIDLTLSVMILALIEAGRARLEPRRRAGAIVLIVGLCGRLFDPLVMAIALGLVGPAVLSAEILIKPTDRARFRLGGLGVWLIVLVGITYPDRPEVWASAVLTPVALVASRRGPWDRVSQRPLVIALGVALGAMILLEGQATLWYLVYDYVPGGRAIRAVGRVGLAVLVPVAIGGAAFFGSPWAARRPIRAGLIGLVCLLEQGVTTPSYSKAAERERIAALAGLVDPRATAFYYRPRAPEVHIYQLDAMMMSLQTGVPTVNGYSGGFPRAWLPLMRIDIPHGPTPHEALGEWLGAYELTPRQVQVIGEDLRQPVPWR